MAVVVSIVSKHELRIEVHHRNQLQPDKTKLASHCFHLKGHLKQVYVSNKIGYFLKKSWLRL